MYLRKVERHYKNKTYVNYLLVESVYTHKGPRQRVVCSLGNLKPKPAAAWQALLERAAAALAKLANGPEEGRFPASSRGKAPG